MIGPGKYDALTTHVREQSQADGVIVVVLNGARGSGFSVQAPLELQLILSDLLESLAKQIRADLEGQGEPS